MRAMIENLISPAYVLYIIPRALDIFREIIKILKLASNEVAVPLWF